MDTDILIDNLFMVLPTIHKRFAKDMKFTNCTRQQVGLLFLIKKDDNKPMSFYSEKLMLPRSNLTAMADKLFKDGFIERLPDENDRRIISLKITEEGRSHIEHIIKNAREGISDVIKKLDEQDIELLGESINTILTILEKIDNM